MLQNLPHEEQWRTLARQDIKEQDPEKMVELSQLIVDAYQEDQRKGRAPRGTRRTEGPAPRGTRKLDILRAH